MVNDHEGVIRLESWVLVKREGVYYEVHCFHSEPLTLNNSTAAQELLNSIATFHDRCLRIKYLYVLPDKINLERNIKAGRLKKSINILNTKERFLLKTRIL